MSARACGAAPPPCAGRSRGSASSERKNAPGRRAGARGRGRGAAGVARRAGRGRSRAAGLRRRDRDRHPDGPALRPRRARAAGARQAALGALGAANRHRRPRARLALDGVVASMSVAAATSTAVFVASAEPVLAPALRDRPDALVVMDNLPAHKAGAVRDALDRAGPGRAGLGHRHLPPYSPDPNPIEQAWSKLKARLRAEGARSRETLEAALGPALATITARDARGWFRLAGYAPAN